MTFSHSTFINGNEIIAAGAIAIEDKFVFEFKFTDSDSSNSLKIRFDDAAPQFTRVSSSEIVFGKISSLTDFALRFVRIGEIDNRDLLFQLFFTEHLSPSAKVFHYTFVLGPKHG